MPNSPEDKVTADLQHLRWTAEGARGVADGNTDVLADAANIEAAADELERLRAALQSSREEES